MLIQTLWSDAMAKPTGVEDCPPTTVGTDGKWIANDVAKAATAATIVELTILSTSSD